MKQHIVGIHRDSNGGSMIVVIIIMLVLACVAGFFIMNKKPVEGKAVSSKPAKQEQIAVQNQAPGKKKEPVRKALVIGTAEYLQEKFGLAPERDRIWAHREYSVMRYRDPKTPESKEVPAGTIAPWESWPFIRETADANLAGLNSVSNLFYAYPSRQLALWSKELIDPVKNNALSDKNPARMMFRSSARWGWSPDNYFNPVIMFDNSETLEEYAAVKGALKGLYVVEDGGERGMADLVWPLLVKDKELGSLVLRCVLRADEPQCLYARAFLIGDPYLVFKEIKLCSWSGHPSSFPGSEIWIGGAIVDIQAPAPGSKLPLDEYWFFVTHKKKFPGIESRGAGASGVIAPEMIEQLRYTADGAGGGGGISMIPRKGYERGIVFAIEDFGGDAGGDAEILIAKLRREAAGRKQRLAKMNWHPNWKEQVNRIDSEIKIITEALGADNQISMNLKEKRKDFETAVAATQNSLAGSTEEIRCAKALQVLGEILDVSWVQAEKDLISKDNMKVVDK